MMKERKALMLNIVCDKNKLTNGVGIVLKAIPAHSTMTILECMVLDAHEGKIHLVSNDLEIGIETIIEGEIKEEGSVAVNAKVISEIIRKMPDFPISIQVDDNYTIHITCGKSKFDIAGRSTEEFPFLPNIIKDTKVEISQFTLKEIIRQTVFSISDNENNKLMTGELFEIEGDNFSVTSLDGHRISIRRVTLKKEYDHIKVVIPGKTLNEIIKILSGDMDEIVEMYFTDKHVMFSFNDTIVLSRLIEGEYYKIEQMLSSDYETKLSIDKKEFLNSIERAVLLVKENDKKPVIMDIKDDYMNLSLKTMIGSMNEDIDITKEGKDIMIGFNPKFLIDALRVIEDEKVDIYMINPKAPCFLKNEDETYIYLILPVNFNVD